MRIGIVGLGRMGLNMTRRLLGDDHEVVGFDTNDDSVKTAAEEGAQAASSMEELVGKLEAPRVVWVMVPAGKITSEVISTLEELLDEGDIIVDGGNSKWKDTISHHDHLATKGIELVDAGTSGGVWGLEVGYCLMVGGSDEAFARIEPALKTLAPEDGYAHVGPSGAGHFVKMIHNGIEYGMLQAYGEGFEILERSEYDLDLHQISALWNHGSVVRSWLLELLEKAYEEDPGLAGVAGYVEDSGEGRWALQAAIHEAVPAPALAAALFARFYSRLDDSYGAKVIAALRNQFGGHEIKESSE